MRINKIVIKVLSLLLIVNIIFLPTAHATTIDSIIESGEKFLEAGNKVGDTINEQALQGTSSFLFKTLLVIAICISVIVGVILGIQFIFGSVEGKAKVSEALVPYIVGCAVVFGAFTIWSFVVNVGQKIF